MRFGTGRLRTARFPKDLDDDRGLLTDILDDVHRMRRGDPALLGGVPVAIVRMVA